MNGHASVLLGDTSNNVQSFRQLRVLQGESWALQRVKRGVEHAKAGRRDVALTCYKQALQLSPKCGGRECMLRRPQWCACARSWLAASRCPSPSTRSTSQRPRQAVQEATSLPTPAQAPFPTDSRPSARLTVALAAVTAAVGFGRSGSRRRTSLTSAPSDGGRSASTGGTARWLASTWSTCARCCTGIPLSTCQTTSLVGS